MIPEPCGAPAAELIGSVLRQRHAPANEPGFEEQRTELEIDQPGRCCIEAVEETRTVFPTGFQSCVRTPHESSRREEHGSHQRFDQRIRMVAQAARRERELDFERAVGFLGLKGGGAHGEMHGNQFGSHHHHHHGDELLGEHGDGGGSEQQLCVIND